MTRDDIEALVERLQRKMVIPSVQLCWDAATALKAMALGKVEADEAAKNASEMRDAAVFIAMNIKDMAEKQHERAESADARLALLEKAGNELVRLQKVRERYDELMIASVEPCPERLQCYQDYRRNYPLAWEAFLSALSGQGTSAVETPSPPSPARSAKEKASE